MSKTDFIYGEPPVDCGLVELSPEEMMFWLYCPISVPGNWQAIVPDNLKSFDPIISAAQNNDLSLWYESYVYITAKTLWVTPENPGNRPGWHSDGFMTDDINYIWSDANPTVFFYDQNLHSFSADHNKSISEMDSLCEPDDQYHLTYQNKHLLRLDQTVLHKVNTKFDAGLRTFVKISLSKYSYSLRGNSINHKLNMGWKYQNRNTERNCPTGVA